MTTPSRDTSKPSLSYFVPPPPVGWAAIGAFSASEWHTARVLLARRNIVARIGNSVDETGHTIELLVPMAQEAYARSLLGGGIPHLAGTDQRPGGFPIATATVPQADLEIPFATPVHPGLTRRQLLHYNLFLVLAWLLIVVILMAVVFVIALPFH